jgi:large conductance mechanosensitive channel
MARQVKPKELFTSGFVDFIREQGVVGLAVGFVLGAAVANVVKALVDDIVDPLIGLVLGNAKSLSSLVWHVGNAEVRYGDFLAVLLDFVVVAAVIYGLLKLLKLDRLDSKESDDK